MRAWALMMWLLHSGLNQPRADAKRFDPSMVDPLTRRSPLDKNFMRFGRSSPSYTEEEEEAEVDHDAETSKEENFLRSMRGKENFMRFGRGSNDNFMRFGRGNQDNYLRFGTTPNGNFMRFGRLSNDNFMRFGRMPEDDIIRLGRGKQDSYMRFGRGKQNSYMRFGRGKGDNFMRFGRGNQDSYMRFGRGMEDNFMRFGRGKQDSYMRFGRGKQDSFIRYGRNIDDEAIEYPFLDSPDESELKRNVRGKQDNFIRYGKSIEDDLENKIPIAMRSVNGNSNFMRFGRGRPDNFMRFGRSDFEHSTNDESGLHKDEITKNDDNYLSDDTYSRESKSKDSNLMRFGRQPPNKNDGFIRFGRNAPDALEENSQEAELIPQRLKRSSPSSYDSHDDLFSSNLQSNGYNSASTIGEEKYLPPIGQEDLNVRRKRSFNPSTSTPSPFSGSDTSVDFISAKVHFDSPAEPEFRSSLFSGGLPNVIVGPEFSFLPDLNPPPAMLKRGRPGDQNFLRLG